MSKIEKFIALFALIGQVVVITDGVLTFYEVHSLQRDIIGPFLPLVFIASFATMIFLIKDLYKREFENPNAKLTWFLLFVFTGGIGILVYAFEHAIKPR